MRAFVVVLLMIFSGPVLAQSGTDKVYTSVDKMPEFPGDIQKYLSQNIRLPVIKEENNLPGRVVLSFVIDKEGKIMDIKIIRSSALPEYDKHLIEVAKNMPKWKPGTLNGKKVNVKYTLPVTVCFLHE